LAGDLKDERPEGIKRRPVARTAATKSTSSHELMLVRSIGGLSSSSSASSGTVGFPWPDATFTVECTIGSPNVFAVFTVDTMFLSSRPGSMDRTVANCAGW
jgi:hypothetical protein